MGLRLTIDEVIDQVQRTTPTQDTNAPFRTQDDGAGTCTRLEDLADSGLLVDRLFDVRVSGMPQDDGVASAGSTLRFSADLVVRVGYRRTGSLTRLEQMMAEDAAAILKRLSDPSNWDGVTNNIDALVTDESVPSVDADEHSAVLSIPLRAIYWE